MGVADRDDKFAGFEAGDFGYHHEKCGILGDIKWETEENVGGALVELHIEFAFNDVELEHCVAGGEAHFA